MKKPLNNRSIGILIISGLLILFSGLMTVLTISAIKSNDKNIADLSDQYSVIVSQVKDLNGKPAVVITKTIYQEGKDGKNGITPPCYFESTKCVGATGMTGSSGTNGATGLNGNNATPEQIAVAVAEYLKANPPSKGDTGDSGKDGNDGREIELCYLRNGSTGQRYVGDTTCREIEKDESTQR